MRVAIPERQSRRWALVVVLLAAAWMVTSPSAPPLYDGVGFPDEPYRFVPQQGQGPAATSGEATLKVVDGANTTGLLVNTLERGPQVQFYAPVAAFLIPRAADDADILLRVEPVPPVRPPAGRLESNVYRVTLTSEAGPVSVGGRGQKPAITLRAVVAEAPFPVVHYRSAPDEPWRALATRRVGMDIFNSPAPADGEYVLAPAPAPVTKGGSKGLIAIVVLAALLMIGVLVGVRRLNTAQREQAARREESGAEQQAETTDRERDHHGDKG